MVPAAFQTLVAADCTLVDLQRAIVLFADAIGIVFVVASRVSIACTSSVSYCCWADTERTRAQSDRPLATYTAALTLAWAWGVRCMATSTSALVLRWDP